MKNEVMDVRVLGTSSSGHQLVVSVLNNFLQKAEIPYVLREETDVAVFLKEGLESVPAIQANGKTHALRANGSFNKSLREAINDILKTKNYGAIEKIIIPVDFSDVSMNAFSYGHRMATEIGAVTKALHVYFPSSRDLTENTMLDVDFFALRKDYLDDFVSNFDVDWGSDLMKASLIDKEVRTGFPGEEILDVVDESNASFIIMGSTGDSSRIKKWFGSISTKVMNEANCPVLLVPEKASYKQIKNIMYACDQPALDNHILEQLVAFTKKFDATLHLVHIDNEEQGYETNIKKEVCAKYPEEKIVYTTVANPEVVSALDDFANTNNIDIIAMATVNRSFFQRVFHDSVTKRMSMHTDIPLLILK